jgi:exoribonuclease II
MPDTQETVNAVETAIVEPTSTDPKFLVVTFTDQIVGSKRPFRIKLSDSAAAEVQIGLDLLHEITPNAPVGEVDETFTIKKAWLFKFSDVITVGLEVKTQSELTALGG